MKARPVLFDVVVKPFRALLGVEAASGIALFASAAAAMVWANVDAVSYRTVFELPVAFQLGGYAVTSTLHTVINDVLMALFFFVVGMEIKRELSTGALSTPAKALLPAIAALGGMVVPALIYFALNHDGPGRPGWGIPMATDIAFCVGVLTLLSRRVPRALVVFVTALAVFDDIGGILVIALFYGHGLQLGWLAAAAGVTVVLWMLSRMQVGDGFAYAGLGVLLWVALHYAGVHATLSGVVVGLMIPARPRRPSHEVLRELTKHTEALVASKSSDEEVEAEQLLMIEEQLEDLEAPLRRFVHLWHPIVSWVIMPGFALASAGVPVAGFTLAGLGSPIALGVSLGLVLGKTVGIFTVTMLSVRLGVAPLPDGTTAYRLLGASVVAGIGFTVALFIAGLAFPAEAPLEQAKAGVLVGSVVAGVLGALLLRFAGPVEAEPRLDSRSSAAAK